MSGAIPEQEENDHSSEDSSRDREQQNSDQIGIVTPSRPNHSAHIQGISQPQLIP